MQIHINKDGKQLGPFDAEGLTEQIAKGIVSYDDLAWTEGMAQWQPLGSICTPPVTIPPPPPICVPVAPVSTSVSSPVNGPVSDKFGMTLVGLPLLAAVLIWLGISNSTFLVCLVVIATAILMGIDAKRLNAGSPTDLTSKGKKRPGPLAWTLSAILLWIVEFPLYLHERKRYGTKSLLLPGLASAIIMLATVVLASQQELPKVNDPTVIATAKQAIEKIYLPEIVGPANISDIGEIRYDKTHGKRYARALLRTKLGAEPIYYTVEWQNKVKGQIWVSIQPDETK